MSETSDRPRSTVTKTAGTSSTPDRWARLGHGLPALSVRRPYLVAVVNLLIILAGLSAMLGIEVRELPDIDRPVVTVRANYPGGAPETIDAEITSAVEAAVARVNGVLEVRSSSEENNFRIRVIFRPGVDLITAANDVREAVSRVERQLPDGVENIFVIKADADASPIMRLAAFSTTLPIEELTRVVRHEIVPQLVAVDGVAEITLFGDRKRVLRVVVAPMKLAALGLSVADVSRVLRTARHDVPAGSFSSGEQDIIVRADASVVKIAEIKQLALAPNVRLGDVAEVFFGPEDAESLVRLDGRNVIRLGVLRRARSNTVAISRAIHKAVERLNQRHRDVTLVTIADDAVFIRGAISQVMKSLGLAVLIVIAVIALFLGRLRPALIPAVSIPVALIGTLAAIWAAGFSINLITLLALVLAAGLVVDDAIVVLENIERQKRLGLPPGHAAVQGTQQVFFAVIATTITLACVFLPISFLPSTAGRLFLEFGYVLAFAVVISSFVALSLVPMLAAHWPAAPGNPPTGWLHLRLEAIGARLAAVYVRLLDAVLRAPLILLGLCLVLAALASASFLTLKQELVPKEDRGHLTVFLTGPDGTGLDYTDRQVEAVERLLAPLQAAGEVKSVLSVTGQWDPNRGLIDVPLTPWIQRARSEGEIAASLRRQLRQIPGARAFVWRGNALGLRRAGNRLKFALIGSNYEALNEAARAFVRAMEERLAMLHNFRIEFRATQPQLMLKIDRQRAADLGVSLENLAQTVQALVDGLEVGELFVDDQAVPIILQSAKGAVDDPNDLRNLYVPTTDGRLVPLGQLVSFSEKAVAAELDRHGQRRAIEITGSLKEGAALQTAVEAVRTLAHEKLPPGIGLLFLDEAATLEETTHGVNTTYAIAFVIVFLVLVAQFESLKSALVVLLVVPFGIMAAIFALALTGTSLNIYSQIGILMLGGIMAKNSILMVEFADQLRRAGKSVLAAARTASIIRLRPITMTLASTMLAALPLILGGGPGAVARAAIGWVIFGGLALAAALTLLLTPALYVLIAGLGGRRKTAVRRRGLLAARHTAIKPPST